MSMTIFDAWHIGKPQSIYDLTIMARCVQGIQEETRAADIAEDVVSSALLPWLRSALEFFGDDAADEFAILVGGAVYPVLLRNSWRATWLFPSEERKGLEEFLTKHLEGNDVPNRKESMEKLQAVCEAVYEFSAQSNPSLCFLSDSAGKDVYVRGFGLTKKATQYLDSLYERFEYTNACEMDERDFPALKKQLAASSDKAALLSKAQEERGALWDDALNGCTRFKDAALTFDLDDTGNKAKKVAELRKAAKIIFEEGKGEK